MSTEEKAVHKKTNLEWQARASLRKRIEDPDWDWDTAERYERHAINAILDMEEVEAVNKELLQALDVITLEEKQIIVWLRANGCTESGLSDMPVGWLRVKVADAAIAKARGI